ncbi:hypothetical protein EJB05_15241, partial [Eragrostis curvula]
MRRDTQQLQQLLLLGATSLLFASSSTLAAHSGGLHPVVLLPGYPCSQLEARLTDEYQPPSNLPGCGGRKGKGWFRLWEDDDPTMNPCSTDQLRLVYDPIAGDYRNVAGVETRVVGFGTTRGFGSQDPANRNICMGSLVAALEGAGYAEGENLFGAPYDFRYAPATPGKASAGFSNISSSLTRLVERASKMNGHKPVILVGHSMGSFNTLVFLDRTPRSWRDRYIKHFVMLGMGAGGNSVLLQLLNPDVSVPPANALAYASTTRSFVSLITMQPSPKVFGHTPLVITPGKNYSAHDIAEYLAAVGFSDGEVARYRTRVLPVILGLRAPLVPLTCVNGVGLPTVERLVYMDGELIQGGKPRVVYADGDGIINLQTVLALDTLIGDDPNQHYFKSILLLNVTHSGLISEDSALKGIVSVILQASQAILISKN